MSSSSHCSADYYLLQENCKITAKHNNRRNPAGSFCHKVTHDIMEREKGENQFLIDDTNTGTGIIINYH